VKRFEALQESGKLWDLEQFSCWLVGWRLHLVVQVYEYVPVLHTTVKRYTPAFDLLWDIVQELNDYPILDEEDYCEREYKATQDNIDNAIHCWRDKDHDRPDLTDDDIEKVHSWLWDNCQVENIDDQGWYPSDNDIKDAYIDLGYITE